MVAPKTKPQEGFDREMFDFSVLRDLRRRESLSLAEVSERSGVSAAVISKLERNRTKAELETLFRLSRVFGMNATDLLSLAESRTAQRNRESGHDSGGFHFREVSYGNVRCLMGHGRKGARVSRPEIHGDDHEVCWVLSGCIRFVLPHETHLLSAGEAVQFDAILEHRYEAMEDCELMIVQLQKGKRF